MTCLALAGSAAAAAAAAALAGELGADVGSGALPLRAVQGYSSSHVCTSWSVLANILIHVSTACAITCSCCQQC
jgi:hypothetical protein